MKICLSIVVYGCDPRYYKDISSLIISSSKYSIDLFIFDLSDGLLQKSVQKGLLNSTKVIKVEQSSTYPKKLLRYQLSHFNAYDIALIRDCDYIFTDREFDLLMIWANSKFEYLVIRDHISQTDPIMAGNFSIKKAGFRKVDFLVKSHLNHSFFLEKKFPYRYDQIYLYKYLYKNILKKLIVYTVGNIFRGENYQFISPSRIDSCPIGSSSLNFNLDKINQLYFKPTKTSLFTYEALGYRAPSVIYNYLKEKCRILKR